MVFQKGEKIRLGSRHTEESKAKMSLAKKGKRLSIKHREKLREAHKRIPHYWLGKGENHPAWKGGISKDKKHCSDLAKKYLRTAKGKEMAKKWYERNKKRKILLSQLYRKERRKKDFKLRLNLNIGTMISVCLKGKKAGRKWETLVGYTLQDLIERLEKQFDEKMNWDNYGSYWWIDHIKPRALFRYSCPEDEEFKKCWALNNLQPLEKIANMNKSNKYE